MQPAHSRAATRPGACDGRRLLALCLAPFVIVFDANAVTVALPAIGDGLRIADGTANWVMSALALPFGGLLLAGGRAADRYGRHRMLFVGTVLFAAASATAALAVWPAMLLASRTLQGAGAAFAFPAAVSILTSTYDDGPRRARALAMYGISICVAMVAAAALGGLAVQLVGWRGVFVLELPVAVGAAAAAGAQLARDADRPAAPKARLPTAAAATIAIVATLNACTTGPRSGWSSLSTLLTLAIAVVFAGATAVLDRRAADPLFPARLLSRRTVASAVLAAFVFIGTGFGAVVLLSLHLQHTGGYTPLNAGLLLVPFGLAGALTSVACPTFARRFNVVRLLVSALGVQSAGILLITLMPPTDDLATAVLALTILGLGHGGANVFVMELGTTALPADDHATVVGLITSAAQVGLGATLALLVTVSASLTAALHRGGATARDAATAGFHTAAVLAAGLCLLAGCLVALLGRAPRASAATRANQTHIRS